MQSNQQYINHIGIDKVFHTLQSLDVKTHNISVELFQIKYSNVALYSIHLRYLILTKYKDEKNDNVENVRHPSHKLRVLKHIITLNSCFQQTKGYVHKIA